MQVLAFLFVFFCVGTPAFAANFVVPPLTGPVVDNAHLLSSNTEARLDAALRYLKDQGGAQINVLTVPDIGGIPIEQASIQVTDQWKLGSKHIDNGVLLLIDVEDRAMRIEVGQGLEGDLPDIMAKRIIVDTMTPLFRQQDYDDAILLGVYAIAKHVSPGIDLSPYLEGPHGVRHAVSGRRSTSHLFLWFIILIVIISLMNRFGGGGRGGGFRRNVGYGLGGFAGGWGSSGGGWSGGGSWGGGGGGFSGGGASGRW